MWRAFFSGPGSSRGLPGGPGLTAAWTLIGAGLCFLLAGPPPLGPVSTLAQPQPDPADQAVQGETAAEEPESRLDKFKVKEESYAGKIVVIPVGEKDLIVEARFKFMQRILEKAEEDGASAVILDMNTPGGLAWQSGQLIMNFLPKMTLPTFTYVNPNAVSAGAIIALGTDAVYMAPTSAIGAAAVVAATGQELPETMQDKVDSIMKAQVRSVAKAKGHNPDIAQAFIDKDMEVVLEVGAEDKDRYPMGVKVISKKGELLSFDHEEATEIINGKAVFAKGIAKDLEDLIAQESLEGEMLVAKPLGFETFALWVARFSFLLLALGIAGAYMEMQSPGFGIPGAVSIVCFGIFFFGYYMAGNLAGFEVVAVFLLGLVLIGVEIFLFPGTLVFGLVGLFMMVGALIYTMAGIDPAGGGTFSIDMDGLSGALLNMALGLAGSVLLIALLMRYLPETRAMSWLILKSSVPEGASLELAGAPGETAVLGDETNASPPDSLVGGTGETLTELRPSGKGRFGDQTLDIVSEGEFIEKGTKVRIVAQEGARLVVEEVG